MNTIAAIRKGHARQVRAAIAVLMVAFVLLTLLALNVTSSNANLLRLDAILIEGLRSADDSANAIGPWWLRVVMADITALGGRTVIAIITILAVGYLMASRKVAVAGVLAASVAGGVLLNMALKSLFARERPNLVAHLAEAHSTSFPSAHAMNSAVVYLTLGILLAHFETRRSVRTFLVSAAIALTALVGFSRVYLGVHWPTDVVAGWGIGACWVAICLLTARALQLRGDRPV